MGSGIIAILQFGLFTFVASVAANIVLAVAGYLWAAVIEQTGGVEPARQRIARYSRLALGFQNRLEARKNAAAGSASSLFGAERQEKQLRSRLRELETAQHRFVRVVGQELLPNRCYEAMAINSSVTHQVRRGERHPFYDSSWARAVPVHIWAQNEEEATAEFERVFPKTVGFKILSLMPLGADGRPATRSMVPPPKAADARAAADTRGTDIRTAEPRAAETGVAA